MLIHTFIFQKDVFLCVKEPLKYAKKGKVVARGSSPDHCTSCTMMPSLSEALFPFPLSGEVKQYVCRVDCSHLKKHQNQKCITKIILTFIAVSCQKFNLTIFENIFFICSAHWLFFIVVIHSDFLLISLIDFLLILWSLLILISTVIESKLHAPKTPIHICWHRSILLVELLINFLLITLVDFLLIHWFLMTLIHRPYAYTHSPII